MEFGGVPALVCVRMPSPLPSPPDRRRAMSAKLAGHVTHYSDSTWSARGDGWSVAGNGGRDAVRDQLARHGYRVEAWRSVPGVCYDAPDGTPVYSDLAQVRDRRQCGECGARVSLTLEMYAPCPECGEWL